jgi:alpha-L-arabinofuranosidase
MNIHWLSRRVLVGMIMTASVVFAGSAQTVTLTVETDGAKPISTDLFGIFFEDINYAADGGLYAELIQNRSFEYSRGDNQSWNALSCWTVLESESGQVAVTVESDKPVHVNNPHYAILSVNKTGKRNGLSNEGFGGIVLKEGDLYDVSFFARVISGHPEGITMRLEDPQGQLLGQAQWRTLKREWTKHQAVIKSQGDQPHARLVVLVDGTGTVALDMISLFPQKTFKNRPNGLRPDLAEALADMKPGFMRFPGGCVAHGDGLENMYRWKDTIGPVEQRKAQRNIWRYHQTLGLGYFEYFQFCEDIGAKPVPVVPAGVCCQNSGNYLGLVPRGQRGIPMDEMDAYIQEIFDLIEWANGPATSPWGAKRAAAGHPEPFHLEYIAVGNEDAQTPVFQARFKMIYDAVKAKYPDITVIGNVGPFPDGQEFEVGWAFAKEHDIEMVAEHYYRPPQWFWSNLERYDGYDRSTARIFASEYAAHDVGRRTTLRSALAESAYMTGLERNGDIVMMACYAPLFGKVGATQWNPDLIYFTNTEVAPTINYYVQQLFGNNAGNTYLPTTMTFEPPAETDTPKRNGVILGTWETQARFDDLTIVSGTETVLDERFERKTQGWHTQWGQWRLENGGYVQQSGQSPALSLFAFDDDHSNYTVSLRAMKTGGNEGFLIGFGAVDTDTYYWLNLGGWANTRHQIEKTVGGVRSPIGPSVPGRIESDRWYEINIQVAENHIRCYLDGQLIIEMTDRGFENTPDMAVSTVREAATGDVIVKLVSKAAAPIKATLDLRSVGPLASSGVCTVLSGDPMAENRPGQLPAVLPKVSRIAISEVLEYEVLPHSLTVIRLTAEREK